MPSGGAEGCFVGLLSRIGGQQRRYEFFCVAAAVKTFATASKCKRLSAQCQAQNAADGGRASRRTLRQTAAAVYEQIYSKYIKEVGKLFCAQQKQLQKLRRSRKRIKKL